LFRSLQTVHIQRIPNPRAANSLTIDGHGAGVFNGEIVLLSNLLQQAEIARPVTAKTEVIAHNQMAHGQAADQQVLDKAHGGIASEGFINRIQSTISMPSASKASNFCRNGINRGGASLP